MVILGPSSFGYVLRQRKNFRGHLFIWRKVWGQNSSCEHYGSQPNLCGSQGTSEQVKGGLVCNRSGELGWSPVSGCRDAIAPGRVNTMVWFEKCPESHSPPKPVTLTIGRPEVDMEVRSASEMAVVHNSLDHLGRTWSTDAAECLFSAPSVIIKINLGGAFALLTSLIALLISNFSFLRFLLIILFALIPLMLPKTWMWLMSLALMKGRLPMSISPES